MKSVPKNSCWILVCIIFWSTSYYCFSGGEASKCKLVDFHSLLRTCTYIGIGWGLADWLLKRTFRQNQFFFFLSSCFHSVGSASWAVHLSLHVYLVTGDVFLGAPAFGLSAPGNRTCLSVFCQSVCLLLALVCMSCCPCGKCLHIWMLSRASSAANNNCNKSIKKSQLSMSEIQKHHA